MKAPDAQGFGKVRTVDIGDFDMAIAIKVSGSDWGEPAIASADMGGGGDFFAVSIVYRELSAGVLLRFNNDNFE